MIRVPTETAYQLSGVGSCLCNCKIFPTSCERQNVLIRCDNTSVVQQISKQGGTKSPQLCYITWDLWNFAIQSNCSHIRGSGQTCGQVEQEKGYGNRMVTQQVSCTSIISDLGVSINRPVCLRSGGFH